MDREVGVINIMSLHALESSHTVAHRVYSHVAHVQAAARIGEHGKRIERATASAHVDLALESLSYQNHNLQTGWSVTTARHLFSTAR